MRRAVGPDHAVAGDDDGDRIAAVGGADDAGSLPGLDVAVEERRVDPRRQLAVAGGLPVGDLQQRSPGRLLQRRAAKVDLQVELPQLAGEVGLELVGDLGQRRLLRLGGDRGAPGS